MYYLQEKNITQNEQISLEHYIASKVLRSPDALDTHKFSEMISMIKYLLKIDSKVEEQITKNHYFNLNNVMPYYNILDSIESTNENIKVILPP